MTHSPHPWTYEKSPTTGHSYILDANRQPVGQTSPTDRDPVHAAWYRWANGSVMAAAPELLEILEAITTQWSSHETVTPFLHQEAMEICRRARRTP